MIFAIAVFLIVFFFVGIRIVRPTEVGVIERLGRFKKVAQQGFHWIFPVLDRMIKVNVTEIRVDIPPQEVITKDKLNAHVDAVVYFRIRNARKALYNVEDYYGSVVSLARTTLRAVVGKMTLGDANERRDSINHHVEQEMSAQIEKPSADGEGWGIDILRVEIQEITPPGDVQAAMNNVVKAENEKIAAIDLATATETKADGEKRGAIKKAEGMRQAKLLEADGEAQAIKLVNEAANKYFKGNAQILKKLETVEISLKHNAKIVVPTKTELVNVIGELAGVAPIRVGKSKK
ncbi:SPFH/Band 7/PHB domain protein [archaeon]|jgi:regulator of protease activity HflC (stomatin/prohibitin superfamily)|nr:SPFH/Band 7/PHB domain protein [archaeon]MBT4021828.1 SPFH/Band 7/PHB domain protein [archaeon]MBT4272123.1 SPFH/Band 7/PHB domain protein [archaeon]MBT4460304.1 SPFH/Band 7/PHB domain protein [archaeon]MBT4858928.1 SPFH/Band 7/PHB domain protein [archaeon]